MTCGHCGQPSSSARPLCMHEQHSDTSYHARCWYEMKTGEPIHFPESELTWRTIELIRLLEVMDGHGEAASSATIENQRATSAATVALIHDPVSPLPYRVVRRWHETPDTLEVLLLTADPLEAKRVYYTAIMTG